MLAQIRNFSKSLAARRALLVAAGLALSSCATKAPPPLITDNTGRDSSLPWSEKQKWEGQGQLGAMAERFETRGNR